ncbi:MAG: biopolymer transporter ExbD [Gammaproteobacteria bacterium]|nr:biopolymer transporter ExbD [Gammaproteobacteria bacterium]
MQFRRRPNEEPEINLVPMIDVLLMTLIFLILTTSFAHRSALKVQLPQAQSPKPLVDQGVRILIDAAGDYAVNGVMASDREARLMQVLAAQVKSPSAPVIIYADRMAPYRAVVHALDAARRLGLNRIVFATKGHKAS